MQAAARTSHPIPSVFLFPHNAKFIFWGSVLFINTSMHRPIVLRTLAHTNPRPVCVFTRVGTRVWACVHVPVLYATGVCVSASVCVSLCVHMSVGCTWAILPSCRRSTTLFNGPVLLAHAQREPKQKGGRKISRSRPSEPHEMGNFFFLLYKQKKTRSQFALM